MAPSPETEMPRQELSPARNDGFGYFSEDDEADKSLLIRFALRCEILSLQLDQVLGRPIPPGPYLLDHERSTNYGLNVRYGFIRNSMNTREEEIPILKFPMSAEIDHTNLIDPRFLQATIQNDPVEQAEQSVQDGQIGQEDLSDQIDLNYSQADLNSNIQINYPETTDNSFTEDTSVNYLDATGSGNDTSNTGNYREEGEEIISQALAGQNINSFALIHNDGNAHFRGSVPDSSFDLSEIEPYDETDGVYESYDGYDDDGYDLEFPFNFEN